LVIAGIISRALLTTKLGTNSTAQWCLEGSHARAGRTLVLIGVVVSITVTGEVIAIGFDVDITGNLFLTSRLISLLFFGWVIEWRDCEKNSLEIQRQIAYHENNKLTLVTMNAIAPTNAAHMSPIPQNLPFPELEFWDSLLALLKLEVHPLLQASDAATVDVVAVSSKPSPAHAVDAVSVS
jgi:hypothetical protein